MAFGQLIIGPPGSGKTTYCTGVAQFLRSLGRVVCIVNLDPANDRLPYECAVDLSDLVSVEEVQSQLALGPNGALVYCMDYLRNNLDWLHVRVLPSKATT
jgi:GTPase SAR1 family protein